MTICPITYQPLLPGESQYSKAGLRLLSPALKSLSPLSLSADDLRLEAVARAGKMSIQGVQPKLSARLLVAQGAFELVDNHGQYILKPPSYFYPELPENEAVTMSMAALVGIDVPVHGLVYGVDGKMTYFIKRFDRKGRGQRLAVEDFSQLCGLSRDDKYKSSMEKIADVVLNTGFCTFPVLTAKSLFKRVIFCYLTGNEDMHLKNFSLFTQGRIVTLAPAYDLLNTTIAQKNTKEEFALPINGKKNNVTRNDLIQYFGKKRLKLNDKVIESILSDFKQAIPKWMNLLEHCFLSEPMSEKYQKLISTRAKRLGL